MNYVKQAFTTRAYEAGNSFCQSARWNDYYYGSAGKRIVLLGVSGAFWNIANEEKLKIRCAIDWSGNYKYGQVLNGIPIYPPQYLDVLLNIKNLIYIITATNKLSVNAAAFVLEERGIKEYYSFSAMECARMKYLLVRPIYNLMRFGRYLLHKDGFIRNVVSFNFRKLLRRLGLQDRAGVQKIKRLKNRHRGQRCFIVATGPSLTVSDIEMLEGEITFGVNHIFDMFTQTAWRPIYYAILDHYVFADFAKKGEILDFGKFCKSEHFVTDRIKAVMSRDQESDRCIDFNYSFLNHASDSVNVYFKHNKNISFGMYNALTVVNTCINIAHYMGFAEIYLLGVDCNYNLTKQYFNEKKNMFASSLEYSLMISDGMKKGFSYIKKKMDKYGVRVYNATRGGMLEVFPRVDLEDVIQANNFEQESIK